MTIREGGTLARWITLGLSMAVAVVSVSAYILKVEGQVCANTDNIRRSEARILKLEDMHLEQTKALNSIDTKQQLMLQKLTDIEKKVNQ